MRAQPGRQHAARQRPLPHKEADAEQVSLWVQKQVRKQRGITRQNECDSFAGAWPLFGQAVLYSPLMPAVLMIGHHFSVSSLWKA